MSPLSPAAADTPGPVTGSPTAGRAAGTSLWRLVLTQPHLLADHLGAYAALVRGEAAASGAGVAHVDGTFLAVDIVLMAERVLRKAQAIEARDSENRAAD